MQNHLAFKSWLVAIAVAAAIQNSVQAQNYSPIPLTANSFTYQIVVPSNCPAKPNAQMVTVTLDAGPSLTTNTETGNASYVTLSGNTMFELGLDRASATASNTYGVPHGGTLLTNITRSDHVYQLPYWTNISSNCLFVGNYPTPAAYTGGTNPFTGSNLYTGQNYTTSSLTLNTNNEGTNYYTALSLLDSSGNGSVGVTVLISYADGTTQTVGEAFPDWFNSFASNGVHTAAYNPSARLSVAPGNGFSSTGTTSGSRLYGTDIGLSDTNSPITNINFTWTSGGRTAVFAVSGTTNTNSAGANNSGVLSGPFVPIPVTGFNAGCVVPNMLPPPAPLPYNATMDNGTNFLSGGAGANTWFEKGWDIADTNGFPIHGTILTSFANPNRSYQMAPTYSQNMATLIDTNHQMTNITPITPLAFTAISFLTAGAAIGAGNSMTNYCILQHADGVNESNVFIGKDWFDNTVSYAYVANARANFNNAYEVANNLTGDPRLFESTFTTVDGTPVTNFVVGFRQAGGNTWTTYIIGVSGTTNFVVPAVGTNTAAQNVYPGQTAIYSISLALGAHPTPNYQWQVTDNVTFTNNLTNGATGTGSTISGATGPTLTIANVSSSDTGNNNYDYQCYVSNPAGNTTSPAAPLTLLVSTATNVVLPSDPISDFYGGSLSTGAPYSSSGSVAGEAYPSPAGLTVNYVIDGTDEQYLNYGASGGNGSFVGPIGFTVQPSAGSSVVNALRFVTPVNAAVCDPADFALDGSQDGVTWTSILPDTLLNLPNARNLLQTASVDVTNQVLQEVDFANTNHYSYYRVSVLNTKGGAAYNSVQIGELQFLGGLAAIPPGIFTQPSPPVQNLQVGGRVTWTVGANGPQPITYQWYQVTTNGATNLLSGATGPSFTLASVGLTNSGSYFCVVGNTFGSTNTVLVTINVLAPTSSYVTAIVNDGPTAYLRLDESLPSPPNDGVIAYDTVGGHNGYYSNVVQDAIASYGAIDPNELTAEFGQLEDFTISSDPLQDNLVAGINGINLYAPSNSDKSFSVEAWVYLNSSTQIGGAGIVSKGYGGGGEEFALDTGGTDNDYRFYYRNAGGIASGNVSPNASPAAGVWTHVVGVLYQSNNVAYEYIYTNGILGASSATIYSNGPGVFSNDIAPVVIGARSSSEITNYNDQLEGAVADVAIYPYALTSNQVLSHFLASGIAPIFSVTPTNATVEQGQTAPAVFYSSAYGSPTVSYQWQLGGVNLTNGPSPSGTGEMISGATSSNLTVSDATTSDNGETFMVVASNSFGINSASAILTVASGPPVIVVDVQPSYSVVAGASVSLAAYVNGTVPFFYQWTSNGAPLANGGPISGATSNILTIGPAALPDAATYQLNVSNAIGSNQSSAATLTVVPYLTFNGLGAGWSLNGGATYVSSNVLELTDGTGGEGRSSFYSNTLYVGAFEAAYIYTDTNGGGADGVCFVLQDDPRGPLALGGAGGQLGYGTSTQITPSVSLQFNIYSGNAFGGQGVAFGEDGAVSEVNYFPDIASGDPMSVFVSYNGSLVNVSIVDTLDTNVVFTLSTNVNIPAVLGTNTAYVGFTGADGGTASIQTITGFEFIPLPSLTATLAGANIVLSWPPGTGAYQLESNTNLANTNGWVNVPIPPVVANGRNQVTAPLSGAQQFYRLQLQ